jgi:hypothetical protein
MNWAKTGVYYDEKGHPMFGSALVRELGTRFSDDAVLERLTRETCHSLRVP